jgi:hypothetical protein
MMVGLLSADHDVGIFVREIAPPAFGFFVVGVVCLREMAAV